MSDPESAEQAMVKQMEALELSSSESKPTGSSLKTEHVGPSNLTHTKLKKELRSLLVLDEELDDDVFDEPTQPQSSMVLSSLPPHMRNLKQETRSLSVNDEPRDYSFSKLSADLATLFKDNEKGYSLEQLKARMCFAKMSRTESKQRRLSADDVHNLYKDKSSEMQEAPH